jgi:hypothetical protein
MNSKGLGWKQPWNNLRYNSSMAEAEKKTMIQLSQDNSCIDQDSNRAPLKYKFRVLLLYQLTQFYGKIWNSNKRPWKTRVKMWALGVVKVVSLGNWGSRGKSRPQIRHSKIWLNFGICDGPHYRSKDIKGLLGWQEWNTGNRTPIDATDVVANNYMQYEVYGTGEQWVIMKITVFWDVNAM